MSGQRLIVAGTAPPLAGQNLACKPTTISPMTDIIEDILAGRFTLELPKCRLIQRRPSNPTMYEGAGFVDQLPDGTLRLRMHATCSVPQMERFKEAMNMTWQAGKVLGDDHYYDFEAQDNQGGTWQAERESIKESCGLGDVVYSDLRTLTRRTEWAKPGWARQWRTRVELDLPWNATTDLPNGGWRFDRFIHEDAEFEWAVQKVPSGSKIDFTVRSQAASEGAATDFLRALSILVGGPIQPAVTQTRNGEELTTRLHRPTQESVSALLTPLPHPRLNQSVDFNRFIHCCLDSGTSAADGIDRLGVLYQFWHRIQAAHQKDVENSALVLSVAIEGVVKAIYLNEHDGDASVLPQIEEAAEAIKTITLGERARQILSSALANAKTASPRGVLLRLAEQGLIEKKHVEAWRRLRNTGAHGELLEDDPSSFQRYMDTYWVCMDLFFRLFLCAIGYRGARQDYSAAQWPVVGFPPGTQAESLVESVSSDAPTAEMQ